MENTQRTNHGLQIVVLEQGFVYIGYVITNGQWVHISNAYNVRRWGTDRGLGQLVSGPTPHTVLDKVGTVRAPWHALVHLIEVEAESWQIFG